MVELFNRRALELLDLPLDWLGQRLSLATVLDYQQQLGEFEGASEAVQQYVRGRALARARATSVGAPTGG
jgi:hypothetical protein